MKIQYVNRTSGANAACTNDDTGEVPRMHELRLYITDMPVCLGGVGGVEEGC